MLTLSDVTFYECWLRLRQWLLWIHPLEPGRPWVTARFCILFCTLLFWWNLCSSIPASPIPPKHPQDCNSFPILEVVPYHCPGGIWSYSWVEATLHLVEKQATRATNHSSKVLVGASCWSHFGWMLAAYIIAKQSFLVWRSICSNMIFFLVLFMVCSIHLVCRTFHGRMALAIRRSKFLAWTKWSFNMLYMISHLENPHNIVLVVISALFPFYILHILSNNNVHTSYMSAHKWAFLKVKRVKGVCIKKVNLTSMYPVGWPFAYDTGVVH